MTTSAIVDSEPLSIAMARMVSVGTISRSIAVAACVVVAMTPVVAFMEKHSTFIF